MSLAPGISSTFLANGSSQPFVDRDLFDSRVMNNSKFKGAVDRAAINRTSFRNYYGFEASVAFSWIDLGGERL
jgi:hypothetical protein